MHLWGWSDGSGEWSNWAKRETWPFDMEEADLDLEYFKTQVKFESVESLHEQ